MKIAVLIPCYNESLTIAKVVKDYKNVFPTADIYVYDNNSTDGTDVIARGAGAIVRYEYRQGKGNVIRSMFKDIDADCYIMADGDDTNPPVPEMANLILEGKADMVIGDRLSSTYFTENKRMFHNSGNKLVRFLINSLFKVFCKQYCIVNIRIFFRKKDYINIFIVIYIKAPRDSKIAFEFESICNLWECMDKGNKCRVQVFL